ncbi:toxin [candidate division KSB1 bacterium 4572_119]|nr:MAG: toxin [candidate division KSB1 bacterium 4572_119]
MKLINWNKDKNIWLKKCRKIGFEDVLYYMDNNFVKDDIEHTNKEQYPNQRIFVLDIEESIYLVPYVESNEEIFLKTIIPSRKATRDYLGEKNDE